MSKRRIERSIDDLEAEVLEDLSAEERLPLFLEAAAAGNEVQLAKLRDTTPIATYRATDPAYADLGQAAILLLQRVVYDLHTTTLEFTLANQMVHSNIVRGFHRDDEPTEDELEAANEVATTVRDRFASLYSHYHASRRFATEVLGVELETWVRLHSEGPRVVERVAGDLDNPLQLRLAEEYLRDEGFEFDAADGERAALEGLTEWHYEVLVARWDEIIS